MQTPPPRAILARFVAISLIATALPLHLPGFLLPGAGGSVAGSALAGTAFAQAATTAKSATEPTTAESATAASRTALTTLGATTSVGSPDQSIRQQFSTDGSYPIGPGVDHTWGTIVTSRGQQVVHMVQVAPAAPGISIEAGLSNDAAVGLEKTSTQANRKSAEGHRAIAAINGDSWSGSSSGSLASPNGLDIQNRELMVAASNAEPSFGVDATGQPIIGAPIVTTNIILPDTSFHGIDNINQRRGAGETTLYTPRFGSRTDSDSSGVAVVLTGVPLPLSSTVNVQATVVSVGSASGGTPIEPGTVVIVGPSGSYLASLQPQETVQLTVSITAEWQNVVQAIGARGFLVRNGSSFVSPVQSDASQSEPRTAIGITAAGGVMLVTVDGRATDSTGVTDSELAAMLIERGAVSALNLDGGGSTVMAVRQPGDTLVSVVNRPSDGSERPVSNSIIVFSSAPTGPLASLTASPNNQSIYTTQAIDFDVFGQDAAYNPVPFSASAVHWSVSGAGGTFNSNGGFTATSPGSATVTATLNGVSDSVHLTVKADTSPPVAEPPVARIITGTTLGATVPINVSWGPARDVGLGVAGYRLQQDVNAKGWKTFPSGAALNRHADPEPNLTRNDNYQFALQASDRAGNLSGWLTTPSFRAVVLSEASSAIHFSSGWSRITSPSYDGDAAKSTRTAGASATYSFVGDGFAWVAAKSPVRGLARVYVDGQLADTVSTYAPTAIARRIVFSAAWPTIGRHTIKIVALGTKGHPRVDVDAFIVLASPTITAPTPPATKPGPTPTPKPTPTPTPAPKPTPSPTAKPSPTPSASPSPSLSPSPSPSGSGSPSPSPSGSPVASATL